MIKELDLVVLTGNLPAKGLFRGDVGAVVAVYTDNAYEVEFTTFKGKTVAVITLEAHQIRPIESAEMMSVRTAH